MPRHYPTDPSSLATATLDAAALQAIGRLVRANAEIEDMLMLFIGNLAGLSEAKKTVLMVGRKPIREQLDLAQRLAALHSPAAAEVCGVCFDATYLELVDARNDVAHVVLVGRDDDGRLTFLNQKPAGVGSDGGVRQVAASYSTEQIAEAA